MPLQAEGPHFMVRGVEPSDVLYLRAAPGPRSAVVAEIPPDTGGLIGTGAQQKVGPGVWFEIIYGEQRGWVNARFLSEER